MYNYRPYLIENLTPLHVGSGEEQTGSMDNQIQRDKATCLPVINASSLKGALRDFTKENQQEENFKSLFGSPFSKKEKKDEEKKESQTLPGDIRFLEARLFSLPLRSSRKVFYHCTSPLCLKECIEDLAVFKLIPHNEQRNLYQILESLPFTNTDFLVFSNCEGLQIEDFTKKKSISENDQLNKFITKFSLKSKNIALFENDIFKDICSQSLPVIARNHLDENGISQNLFYEEILPRRSLLFFILGIPDKINENSIFNEFESLMTSKPVQIGGNASIGYGLCRISRILF